MRTCRFFIFSISQIVRLRDCSSRGTWDIVTSHIVKFDTDIFVS